MEWVFRVCLFAASVVNLIPSALAFLPDRISSAYGIEIPGPAYELLLRHRAVLFAIVGGIMVYSAFSRKNYGLAVTVGLISMVSFIVLAGLVGGDVGPALGRVMMIDVIATVVLILGYLAYRFSLRSSDGQRTSAL